MREIREPSTFDSLEAVEAAPLSDEIIEDLAVSREQRKRGETVSLEEVR